MSLAGGCVAMPGGGSYRFARKWLTCEGGLGDLAVLGKGSRISRAWELGEDQSGGGSMWLGGWALKGQNITSIVKRPFWVGRRSWCGRAHGLLQWTWDCRFSKVVETIG